MISPLTGLPGNVQIQAEMKKRLTNGSTFAMLYIDLDNSQTAFIMKKNYRGDDLAMVPVEIVSVEIDTGWRDITFWDEDNKEYTINKIEDGLNELLDEVISNLDDLLIGEGIRDL